ncbi:MAG TPA: transcription-repair coupling factor [Bryobacteraceae bacterium]|nr:transcription-repair coupling factor [Bryobacteraceae bacterium]
MTHPAVRDLFQTLSRHPAFQEILAKALRHEASELALAGLTPTAKALYLVLLWQLTERSLLVITDGNQSAETLLELTETFFDLLIGRPEAGHPQLLPALDVLPGQNLSPHTEISEQRAIGLWRMAAAKVPITIAPLGSALLRTHAADYYRRLAVELRIGEELPLETIEAHLVSIGYEKREPVEMTGEYSIRGGILDVFPAENARPLRIEFFGDEIESIRRFDVESQRSIMKLTEVEVLPLAEQPRSGATYPGWEFAAALEDRREQSLLDLAAAALIVLDEPEQIRSAAERLWKRLDQLEDAAELAAASFLRWEDLETRLAARRQVAFRELDLNPATPHIAARPAMAFHGSMQVAVAETKNMVESGYRVALFAPSNGELERLADILREYSVPFQLGLAPNEAASPYLAERAYLAGPVAHTYLIKGLVRRGAIFPDSSIAFIGSEDLFDPSDLIARPGITKSQLSVFAADLADLKPGDFVVHTTHGVGRFLGLREIVQGEQKGDFMLLEYAGDSKLYVPLTRMDLVEKYRGGGESGPPLDRLGGATWTQRKTKVKAKMRDMADELLKLYAQRRVAEGYSFSKDSNWQREFEDAFEFTETKDQVSAAKEIKRDMESPHPMDRLLCGDVGFGKTEIAMRAAFKALGDGKQVAVLAPTTVLAFQHFESFKRRFAAFPVRIAMFSRFVPKKELAQSVEELAQGKIDVAIGTHRLLSKDIEFRDLGLLIFDEEQRFGVRHKERLKQMRQNVDVLTMSATPIPRTLHMSMLGIRDMSVIETPPKDRLAIQTVVAHFDHNLIRTAIEQEMSRGGQVYFVHNRVDSIYMRAASILELVPSARIGVGHGQMGEEELERVLLGFMRHEYDVFVCTTIVENGLDIPLANTIIIENAERYGLSEMYQLRGRVGRSNRRAYAYLLVPPDTELSEVARKRLAALREFSDLGAGFKIAALDLELRGAGNLLGGEQHGHIAAVGFDMYLKMLDETVQELKGEETPLEIHSALNLGLDIRIPPEYITDEHQRLRAYKRIADAKDGEQAAAFRAELADRYGPPPEAVGTLFAFALLKTEAEKLGVEAIDRRGSAVQIKFHPGSKVDPSRLMALVSSVDGAQFTPAGVLRLPLDSSADTPGGVLSFLEKSLHALGAEAEAASAGKPVAEQL